MTALRLALSELKRLTHGRMAVIATLALLLVPLLYGALYLWANWNPYGNLGGIKAALVVEDTGATVKGKQQNVGAEVADQLRASGTFDWVTVGDRRSAVDGVARGDYALALDIPADFSTRLASPSGLASGKSADQALLDVTTSDANNYLAGSISSRVLTEVKESVARQVSAETADTLLTSFGTIHDQLGKAADGAGKAQDGARQLRDGAGQLEDGTAKAVTGSTSLLDGQKKLAAGADQLAGGAAQLDSGLGTLADRTASLPQQTRQLADGAAQLDSGLGTLADRTASLPQQTRQLADGAARVASGNAALNTAVQSVVADLDALPDDARARLVTVTAQLRGEGVIDEAATKQILARYDAAAQSSALVTARERVGQAAGQVQALATGAEQVSAGAARLADATPALTDGIASAHTGAGHLATGTRTLADATPSLSNGIASAHTGADRLASGSATLAAGEHGAVTGTEKLATGAQQLDVGATNLVDGASRLTDGTTTLHDQLVAGAGQVPDPDGKQKANYASVISDPLAVATTNQASAATYGAGLAPFFMVLALWIGIFILSQTVRPIRERALASNGPAWKIAVGGWLPFLVLAMVQATLLMLVVEFALGLDAAHPVLMWLLMLVATLAFSSIIQGLIALLGALGKYLVLVLMVLQLVGSGGTFPWQTAPGPLHAVHAVLPMGHAIDGMRRLIYGADLTGIGWTFVGLAAYAVVGVLLATLAAHRAKFWTLARLQPQIVV